MPKFYYFSAVSPLRNKHSFVGVNFVLLTFSILDVVISFAIFGWFRQMLVFFFVSYLHELPIPPSLRALLTFIQSKRHVLALSWKRSQVHKGRNSVTNNCWNVKIILLPLGGAWNWCVCLWMTHSSLGLMDFLVFMQGCHDNDDVGKHMTVWRWMDEMVNCHCSVCCSWQNEKTHMPHWWTVFSTERSMIIAIAVHMLSRESLTACGEVTSYRAIRSCYSNMLTRLKMRCT